eukprot:CAMPEP_0184011488 /NCGR_PEP_ID=MMETSP0954-20121128/3857_1 /TAXON_ID=627963 /ORGANISM="Aplanochytrium sp, Strain PBS07" /LENGTH=459 /DNA_ID=CAMNT_0026291315 /DNA_START=248 /DNA_END=1627 /DNA_ORIENTATION=-
MDERSFHTKQTDHGTAKGLDNIQNENETQTKRPTGEERSHGLWKLHQEPSTPPRCKAFGGRTEKLILRAKRKHRTDLHYRAWSKYKHYKTWPDVKARLIRNCPENIKKIFGPSYDMSRFQHEFEYTNKPCLIAGLCDEWTARENWSFERLREKYGERHFKCGEDDDGYAIKVKLKHFLRYQSSHEPGGAKLDDSPLYIFEPNFDDDKVLKNLVNEYSVPHIFTEDLFSLVGEKTRPPYRWMLFGPERSGSCVHIDPLGSSAWNALLRGRKLWVLFPPEFKKRTVKGKKYINQKIEDDEAIDWFSSILPKMLVEEETLSEKMISFIQRPGETVFVPTDWWHAVLNLDDTIAVTQNFCSSGNFEAVWRHTRTGRTRMAGNWLDELKKVRPDLYEKAHKINEQDKFDFMAVLCKAIAKREAKRERKRIKKMQKKFKREEHKKNDSTDSEASSSSSSESSDSE